MFCHSPMSRFYLRCDQVSQSSFRSLLLCLLAINPLSLDAPWSALHETTLLIALGTFVIDVSTYASPSPASDGILPHLILLRQLCACALFCLLQQGMAARVLRVGNHDVCSEHYRDCNISSSVIVAPLTKWASRGLSRLCLRAPAVWFRR